MRQQLKHDEQSVEATAVMKQQPKYEQSVEATATQKEFEAKQREEK